MVVNQHGAKSKRYNKFGMMGHRRRRGGQPAAEASAQFWEKMNGERKQGQERVIIVIMHNEEHVGTGRPRGTNKDEICTKIRTP
jgi:hypothetical protein